MVRWCHTVCSPSPSPPTLVGDAGSGNEAGGVVLLFQPLDEDLQVQQTPEPRPPPLAQGGTAVRLHVHTGVVQGELGQG